MKRPCLSVLLAKAWVMPKRKEETAKGGKAKERKKLIPIRDEIANTRFSIKYALRGANRKGTSHGAYWDRSGRKGIPNLHSQPGWGNCPGDSMSNCGPRGVSGTPGKEPRDSRDLRGGIRSGRSGAC